MKFEEHHIKPDTLVRRILPDHIKNRDSISYGLVSLASVFTMARLICGFFAIVSTFKGTHLIAEASDSNEGLMAFDHATWAIGCGIICDYLDGVVARWTGRASEFGRELDSLVDVLTFGMAPALLAFFWGVRTAQSTLAAEPAQFLGAAAWVVACAFLICGVGRLARFNLMAQQNDAQSHFVGLAIPGGAAVIASAIHFAKRPPIDWQAAVLWLVMMAALAFLMVSRIRYDILPSLLSAIWRLSFLIPLSCLLLWAVWHHSEYVLLILAVTYAISGPIMHLIVLLRRILLPRWRWAMAINRSGSKMTTAHNQMNHRLTSRDAAGAPGRDLTEHQKSKSYHEEIAKNLAKRAGFVFSIIAAVLLILWVAPPLLFNLGIVAVVTLALREFYSLDGGGNRGRFYRTVGLAGGMLLALQMTIFPGVPLGITITLALVLFLSLMVVKTVAPSMEEFRELMFVMFGMIYVGGMFGQLILIRIAAHGRELTVLTIVTVLAREVGAAVSGRLLSSSKLLNPQINPQKNLVGAAVGIVAAVGVVIGLSRCINVIGFTVARAAAFGLCLGLACQFGDLAESYIKRATGRRHSGNSLGPEGGLLDFLDAATFAIVMARLLLYIWGY